MTRLSASRLFADPPLAGRLPTQVRVAPGGGFVTFGQPAADDRERLDLWCYDVADRTLVELLSAGAFAEGAPTEAERAERERRRQFAGGVTAHTWHPNGDTILATVAGQALLHDLERGTTTPVTPSGTRQTGITLSRTGRFVSYVRDGDLYVHDLHAGQERRVTRDGGGTVANGLPEFIAQEEMHRFEGHWWSPDDRCLAYTRVDVANIPESYRPEIAADRIAAVPQRYPFAGAENADVRLAVVRLDDGEPGEPEWLDWRGDGDAYLARVAFTPASRLLVQVQTRDQRRLRVQRWDPASGAWNTLFEERSATWVNLHDNLVFTGDGETFLWTSEQAGSADLYRFDGSLTHVPAGLHRVARVLGVHAGAAFVTGWLNDPTAQHVYRVPLDRDVAGSAPAPVALTHGDAWHEAAMDPHAAICAVTATDAATPAALHAVDLDSGDRHAILAGAIDGGHPYRPFLQDHVAPRFGSIESADGQSLHYRLTPPHTVAPGERYPVVVHVYGGPGVQRVRREWGPLPLQLFARRGFGVFELDNRGGTGRAKRFEDPIHGRLGAIEVQDQLAGLRFLGSLDWVDSERIGVFGHSYGGYMALMCLTTAPASFAAGVSVAPVTDWALYDTHYTERYLGLPQENAEGYRDSAVLRHLDGLAAPFLLMHGMADDNVLFTHTTLLLTALQERGIAFELMTYPGARHALQEPAVATHRYEAILDFFERRMP